MKRVVTVCTVLVACGGGDDGNDTGVDAAAGKPGHSGYISIQSYAAMQPPGTSVQGGNASAGFTSNGVPCTQRLEGPCTIFDCPANRMPNSVSAGTITIATTPQVTLTPDATNKYTSHMSATPLYAGGATISFATAGGDVPAFTKSLAMPARVTIQTPVEPATMLSVNRTSGLAVAWTGGGGMVQVSLFASQPSTISLECRFDAGAGAGMIPAAALAALPVGSGGYAMATVTESNFEAADYAIELSGYYNAVWPDESIVSGAATFQ